MWAHTVLELPKRSKSENSQHGVSLHQIVRKCDFRLFQEEAAKYMKIAIFARALHRRIAPRNAAQKNRKPSDGEWVHNLN